MPLQTNGEISLSDIRTEFGDSGEVSLSDYYGEGNPVLPASGEIEMSDFYGVTIAPPFTGLNVSRNPSHGIDSVEDPDNAYASASVSTIGGSGSFDFEWFPENGSDGHISVSRNSVGSASYSGTCKVTDLVLGTVHTTSNVFISAIVTEEPEPCFDINTPIWMNDGSYKLAGDLIIGDNVKSFSMPTMIDESIEGWEDWTTSDVSDGVVDTSEVIRAEHHEVSEHYILNNELKVSATHPFLIYRNGIWQWLRTSLLQIGDQFYAEDGTYIPLTIIDHVSSPITVVNIGVEEVDTYFGGALGGKAVLAHNK